MTGAVLTVRSVQMCAILTSDQACRGPSKPRAHELALSTRVPSRVAALTFEAMGCMVYITATADVRALDLVQRTLAHLSAAFWARSDSGAAKQLALRSQPNFHHAGSAVTAELRGAERTAGC